MAVPAIASLPMYLSDRQAVQQLWNGLAEELGALGVGDVPAALAWPSDYHAHWLDPRLLMSQACGYPFIDDLDGKVQLIGCLRYGVPGSSGHWCRSALVAREADATKPLAAFEGRRVAFNAPNSQSGYNALRSMVAPLARQGEFFGMALQTGSHSASMAAVRGGEADLASIDCVSYASQARAHPDEVAGLSIIGWTEPYPGLPLISAQATSPELVQALRLAWSRWFERPDAADVRHRLFLDGFVHTAPHEYDRCRAMRDEALALGYAAL